MIAVSDAYKAAIMAPNRNIIPKVLVYFDGDDATPVEFDRAGCTQLHLLDEVGADTSNPLGLVSANELTAGLNNQGRPLTPTNVDSPYYGLLTPNILVKAYMGVQVVMTTWAAYTGAALDSLIAPTMQSGCYYKNTAADATTGRLEPVWPTTVGETVGDGSAVWQCMGPLFEEIPLGVFRTTDWSTPSATLEATVVCEDLLYQLGQLNVPMLHVLQNTTIGGLFALLFTALGLTEDQYEIDAGLDQPVTIGWIPDDSYSTVANTTTTSETTNSVTGATTTTPVLDALQALAVAGCCWVTCNRYGKIKVQSIFTPDTPVTTWDQGSMIDGADNPQKYLNIYSQVVVNYNMPYIQDSETVLELQNQVIPSGTTTLANLCFTDGPVINVDSVTLSGAVTSRITGIAWGAWTLTLTVENSGATETVDVVAIGEAVGLITATATATDAPTVALIGVKTLTVSCPLIQDQATATEYAATLLSFCKDPTVQFSVDTKGDPAVEVGDVIQLQDTIDKIGTVDVVPIRVQLDYDGGLTGHIDARKPVEPA